MGVQTTPLLLLHPTPNLRGGIGNIHCLRAREQYLQAVESGTRKDMSPVIWALFETELIGLYQRSRSPLGEKSPPGGN